MVVKRFLALTMAGLLAVTSVNTGSIKAYAQEPEQAVLEDSPEEATEEALDQLADEEAESADSEKEEEAVAEAEPVEDEALTEEDAQEKTEPEAEAEGPETETDTDEESVEVTFNAVGGFFQNEEDTLSFSVAKGSAIEELEAPEKEGFTFEGWFLDEEYTQPVDISSFAFVENAVLFAKWQEITDEDEEGVESAEDLLEASSYEITLNGNGGKFSDGNLTYKLTSKTKYLESYIPALDGKVFLGWFSDADCTTSLSSTSNPYNLKEYAESGTEIFAGWSDYYTIIYVFGTVEGTDPEKNTGYYWDYHTDSRLKTLEYKVPKGATLNKYYPSSSYARNTDLHYAFTSWYKDEARTNKISSIYSFKPESDMEIYAGYENNRKLAKIHANSSTAYCEYDVIEYNEIRGEYESGIKQSYSKSNQGYQIYLSSGYFENTDPRMAFGGFYYDKACSEDKKIDGYSIYVQDDVELWVKWEATNKLVTFDVNGGYFRKYDNATEKYVTSTDPVIVGTSGESSYFSPGTLKRDDQHYRFAGWSKNKNATTPDEGLANDPDDDDGSFSFYASFAEDTKLYAVWTKEYIVATYDAGKGKLRQYKDGEYIQVKSYSSRIIDGRPDDYPSESDVIAPSDTQIFSAWYVGDEKVNSIYSYNYTGDVTFTAHYATKYTVTLDANGGYFEEWNSETRTNDHVPKRVKEFAAGDSKYLDTPKNDADKEFGGWYSDSALTKSVPQNYTPTGNITLYAKWLPKFPVTFNYGEGTVAGMASDTKMIADGYKVEKGFSSITNPVPNSDDQAFEGWYTDAEFTNRIEKSDILSTVVTKELTFYARYVQAFTVTFVAGEGSFRSKDGPTYSVKVADGQAVGSKAPTMVSTERNVFEGWFVKNGDQEEEILNIYSYKITADITFYAKYTQCYILTFHANQQGALLDGQETVKIQVTKGTAFRYGKDGDEKDVLYKAPDLDYSGVDLTQALPFVYRYNDKTYGWTTKADGSGDTYFLGSSGHFYYTEDGKRYNFNMYGFVPTGDMDFYARWGEPVTVTFDPNGGTFKTGSSYDEYGTLNSKGQRVQKVPKGIFYTDVKSPNSDSAYPPANSDYTHISWGYLDKDGKDYIGSYKKILEDTIIYGRWYKSSSGSGSGSDTSKTVTLHAKDGYFGSVSSKTSTFTYSGLSTTSTHSTTIPSIGDPNKAFLGWYYDDALTKPYPAEYQFYRSGTWYVIVPKDITDLYAKYGPAFTVKVDANGGYFDKNSDRTKDPDETMRDSTAISVKQKVSGKGITISDYTKRIRRDGDELFDGWYKDPDGLNKALITSEDSNYEYFTPSENCTLYANWKEFSLPEEISISAPATISVGQEVALSATVKPSSFAKEDLHWYVSSYNYDSKANPLGHRPAVLSNNGKLTGQAAGTVNIYAELNGRMSNIVEVTVSNKAVEQSISLDRSTLNLVKNATATITAIVTPASDASKVTWSTSNNKVATVDGSGSVAVITAGDTEGTAVIKATLGSKHAEVTVNVSVPIRLDYNTASLTYKEGNTYALKATPADDYADKNIVWESSDPDVLTVEASGKTGAVVAVKFGKELTEETMVTITATLEGTEYYDKCEFTVRPPETTRAPKAYVDGDEAASGSEVTVKSGAVASLLSETYGATVFYTRTEDGSAPADPVVTTDAEGNPVAGEGTLTYAGAFTLTADVTKVKAVAAQKSLIDSSVSEFTFTIDKQNWGDDIENESNEALKNYIKNEAFHGDSTNIKDQIWYVFGNGDASYGFMFAEESGLPLNITKTYDGSKITFNDEIHVYNHNKKLIENRDYTLTYANNVNVPTGAAATVTIKGKGNYKINGQFSFGIAQAEMNDAVITSEKVVTLLDKAKLSSVKPIVTFNGKKLTANKDYELKYFADKECTAAIAATAALEAGKSYFIQIASKSSNFEGSKAEPIEVKVVAKNDKSVVQASKLKVTVTDAAGKAAKIPYDKTRYAADLKAMLTSKDGAYKVVVADGKTVLEQGLDYELEFRDKDTELFDAYKSAGMHGIVVVGKEKTAEELAETGAKQYVGEKTAVLEIAGTSIAKAKVAGLKTTVEYTGARIGLGDVFNATDKNLKSEWKAEGKPVLYVGTSKLTEGEDYVVSCNNTGIVGKFDIIYTGINGCTGTLKKTITVKAHGMTAKATDITVTAADAVYSKAGATAKVTVKHGNKTLVEGVDYTVTYKNNTKPFDLNTATAQTLKKAPVATVKGMGNYTGTGKSANFSITKAPLSQVKVVAADVVYDAKKNGKSGYFLVVPKLLDGGKAITAGKKKDVDAIDKKTAYSYFYQSETTLEDGTEKAAGDPVAATDKVPAGTSIGVSVKVSIAADNTASPYTQNTDKLVGYYKILKDKTYDISKYTVTIKNPSKLYFEGGDIIRLTEDDLVVSTGKGAAMKVLDTKNYRIVSVSNTNKVGNATVVIEGLGEYGGTKTATLKVTARVK